MAVLEAVETGDPITGRQLIDIATAFQPTRPFDAELADPMTDEAPALQTFDLTDAFFKRQAKLAADLGVGDIAAHPGTKGDDTELNWLHMLDEVLPKRYGVCTAFVVDSEGHQSEQIDVVIHDRHFSPLLFEVGGANYIPAESVYAAFEIKQQLDKAHLEYAGEKIASVRRLHRTSVDVPHAGGKYDPVRPRRIIGGFLARRSDWSPAFGDAFHGRLHALDELGSADVEYGIDIGCAVEHGGLSVDRQWDDLRTMTIEHSESNVALIYFVMRLLRQLQGVGSAPAIDYAYLRSVPGT